MTKPLVAYYRVSTREQGRSGLGIFRCSSQMGGKGRAHLVVLLEGVIGEFSQSPTVRPVALTCCHSNKVPTFPVGSQTVAETNVCATR